MDPADIEAYLQRIGADRPCAADADTLHDLHARHLDSIPFENISVHLRERIVLRPDSLVEKIVHRHRGGFCYELNGAFAALLDALGFRVTLLAASVFGAGGELGPPFDHLALRVDLDEPWLVDVGFGRHTRFPLRLDSREPQPDPAGEFVVRDAPAGDLDVETGGRPVYRVDPRPRRLRDFVPTCWWQATSPDSHFTQNLTCSLPVPGGRITLSGDRLIETKGEHRTDTTLTTDDQILETYRTRFGIALDRVPSVLHPVA